MVASQAVRTVSKPVGACDLWLVGCAGDGARATVPKEGPRTGGWWKARALLPLPDAPGALLGLWLPFHEGWARRVGEPECS